MPHISGTFSHPLSGRLVIKFSGTFFQGTHRDAGFPSTNNGAANLAIRAFAGPAGSYTYTEPIDRYAPFAQAEVSYPGGNVVWNVGTVEVAHVNPTGGIWSYGMDNLKLNLSLQKK